MWTSLSALVCTVFFFVCWAFAGLSYGCYCYFRFALKKLEVEPGWRPGQHLWDVPGWGWAGAQRFWGCSSFLAYARFMRGLYLSYVVGFVLVALVLGMVVIWWL